MLFAPAFPGRSIAASGSFVWSHHTANGWNPKPRLYVGAASCFTEYESISVASKSNVTSSKSRPAAVHTFARAAATARTIARCSTDATACTARHAVGRDATGPNSPVCSRNTAMSDRQSARSAIATARCERTTPGSCVCQRIPHPAIACDNPSVSPDRSASSDSNPTPACDTKPCPSVVTLGRKTERLRCTFKESPLVGADAI